MSDPKISIGLMAYNEAEHITETLESILRQDLDGCEILIGDNASEDDTGRIAADYAARYPFVRHIRHERNVGSIQNFNRLVAQAQGQYFVLAGSHDLWSEGYVQPLRRALDADENAVLAFGLTQWIDASGERLELRSGLVDTSGGGPLARFNLTLWGNQHPMYGMYRLSALRKTRLQMEIVGSGAVMLCELALQGTFIVVPEVTWFRRANREPENRDQSLSRYYRILFSRPRRRILPHWRIPWAFLTLAFRPGLGHRARGVVVLSLPSVAARYLSSMWYDLRYLFGKRSGKKRETVPDAAG